MKTTKLFLIAAAIVAGLVLTTACENIESNEEEPTKGLIQLSTEGFSSDQNTKTSVSGYTVQWVSGDQVYLNGSNYNVIIDGDKAYVDASALTTGGAIYGYYPASIVKSDAQSTTPTVTIPNSYLSSYDADGRQIIALPMAAYLAEGGNKIKFKHLTAAIEVQVKNTSGFDVYLDSVVVASRYDIITGEKTLNLTSDNYSITNEHNGAWLRENKYIKVYFAHETVSIANGGEDIKTVQIPILPLQTQEAEKDTIKVYTHSKCSTVISGEPIPGVQADAPYSFIFSHNPSHPALARNEMMVAKVEIKRQTNAASNHITELDHRCFSVSADKKVYFSTGNLQCWRNSNTDPGSWTFAPSVQQIIYCDDYTPLVSGESLTMYPIELFGYGTSGYNNGQTAWHPYDIPVDDPKADPPVYNYLRVNLTGNMDWGYNKIGNGGNKENSGWRTLTKDEWNYLLFERPTLSGYRYVPSFVNNKQGIILLPDGWAPDAYAMTYEVSRANYSTTPNQYQNSVSSEDWTNIFLPNGAVFLTTTPLRRGADVVGNYVTASANTCIYWTSSVDENNVPWAIQGAYSSESWGAGYLRFVNKLQGSVPNTDLGAAVRLVRDVN